MPTQKAFLVRNFSRQQDVYIFVTFSTRRANKTPILSSHTVRSIEKREPISLIPVLRNSRRWRWGRVLIRLLQAAKPFWELCLRDKGEQWYNRSWRLFSNSLWREQVLVAKRTVATWWTSHERERRNIWKKEASKARKALITCRVLYCLVRTETNFWLRRKFWSNRWETGIKVK